MEKITSDLVASPYIIFQGHAREAIQFHQKALGGKLELSIFTNQGTPIEVEPGDPLMHSKLPIDELIIMGSDGMPAYPPTVGDNVAIALWGSDRWMVNINNGDN